LEVNFAKRCRSVEEEEEEEEEEVGR